MVNKPFRTLVYVLAVSFCVLLLLLRLTQGQQADFEQYSQVSSKPEISLTIDPTNPKKLYLSTGRRFFHVSTNGGENWNLLENPWGISEIVVAPSKPTILYARIFGDQIFGTSGGFAQSTDGGKNWKKINKGLPIFTINLNMNIQPTSYFDLTAIVVHPKIPTTVFAGGGDGYVYQTTDGGENWKALDLGLAKPKPKARPFFGTYQRAPVNALVIDSDDLDTLYAGSQFGGVFKSKDGGQTWQALNNGLLHKSKKGEMGIPAIYNLVLAPTKPTSLYAITSAGVYETRNAGESWNPINDGLAIRGNPATVKSLTIDMKHPDTLYAGTDHGVFKTTGRGKNWNPLNGYLSGKSVSSIHVLRDSSVFYASVNGEGLFKCADSGKSCNEIFTISTFPVSTLAVDPKNPDTLYLGNYSQGVFKSSNGGGIWEASGNGLSALNSPSLMIDSANPSTIYASTLGQGLFKSANGAESWKEINKGLTSPYVRLLTIDPTQSSILYAITTWASTTDIELGLFKSTNGGDSWNLVSRGIPKINPSGKLDSFLLPRALTIDPKNTAIYAATNDGVFKSTDGGINWVARNNGINDKARGISAIAMNPQNPDILYAGTNNGMIYRTSNAGSDWSANVNGLAKMPSCGMNTRTIVIDPKTSTTLYSVFYCAGIYKSQDGGVSWNAMNNGLVEGDLNIDVLTLEIDPKRTRVLYAGTSRGLFKSTNGGMSWSPADLGLPHH